MRRSSLVLSYLTLGAAVLLILFPVYWMAIISLKLDGTILSWNIGAQHMYGYSETEVLGRPVFMIIPAELQEEEQGLLQQVRTGRGIDERPVRAREYQLQPEPKPPFPLSWPHSSASPWRDRALR